MNDLRALFIAVLLACGPGCGDDEPARDPMPDASDRDPRPDASDRDPTPDASDRDPTPDASDVENCPTSGVPAVAGCPCSRPEGVEYCCGVGNGVICEKKVWITFLDSPCAFDQDGGIDPSVQEIECRR